MRYLMPLVFWFCLSIASASLAGQTGDLAEHPKCSQCGMDRGKFSHSRMTIVYEDGSTVATCSLHCTAVELANTIDRIPVIVLVSDYKTKEPLDCDQAIWVMGGGMKGVMTSRPKWAFSDRKSADLFIQANGGSVVSFDDAIKAAYDDMYQDTKMIRELRKLKRLKQGG